MNPNAATHGPMETRRLSDTNSLPLSISKSRFPALFPLSPPPVWARLESIDKMLAELSHPQPPLSRPIDKGKKRAPPTAPYPTPPGSNSDPGSVSPSGAGSSADHSVSILPSPSSSSLYFSDTLSATARSSTINSPPLRYGSSQKTAVASSSSIRRIYDFTVAEHGFEFTDGLDFLSLADRPRPLKRKRPSRTETESIDTKIPVDEVREILEIHSPQPEPPLSQLEDDPSDLPFELALYPTKGFGLRARRPFSKGDVIVREAPFYEVPTDKKHLVREFALSDDPSTAHLRILLLSFTNTVPDIDDIYLNILETNCLTCSANTGDNDYEENDEDEDDDEEEEDNDEEEEDYDEEEEDYDEEEEDQMRREDEEHGSGNDKGGDKSWIPAPLRGLRRRSDRLKDIPERTGREARTAIAPKAARINRTITPSDSQSSETGPTPVGLFKYISRVSHSCAPNAGWRWEESKKQLALCAFHHIEAGEEITASYLGPTMQLATRKKRRQKLRRDFGFSCACRDCAPLVSFAPHPSTAGSIVKRKGRVWTYEDCSSYSARIAKREDLREEYRDLETEWGPSVNDPEELAQYALDRAGSLKAVDRALDLANKLGLYSCQADALIVRFEILAAWSKYRAAKEAAETLYQFFKLRNGREEADKSPCATWHVDPAKSEYWGLCTNLIDKEDALDPDWTEHAEGQKAHKRQRRS